MRVLQIGLGRWGQNHLRAWRRLGVELYVCDVDPALLAATPEPGVADPNALLDGVDCVDVVTPAPTHASLIELALDAGKHVFVEKPITATAEDGMRLAALAHSRSLILQVGHVFRFAPELRALREALAGGRIGEPRFVRSHFLGFKRPRNDGGVAISDAIHFVDVASWLLRAQPERVTAVARDALGRGMDDQVFLALEYGSCLAQIEAGYFAPQPRRDVVVVGSEGALGADLLAKTGRLRLFANAHRRGDDGSWQAAEGEVMELPYAAEEPLFAELAGFLEAASGGRSSTLAADGFAGASAVAVIEAGLRSAAEQRTVEIKPLQPFVEQV